MLRSERANAILEMLLFVPLMLLFLFVAIDGGLAFTEKAAIADAVRGALNSERACAQNTSVLSIDSNLAVATNVGEAASVAQCLSNTLTARVTEVQGQGRSNFRVTVSAWELTVDPASGAVLEAAQLVSVTNPPDGGDPHLPGNDPVYHDDYISEQTFVQQQIQQMTAASPYAIPLSVAYQASTGATGTLSYLEKSIVLYAEVAALARGIHPAMAQSVVGKFYAVEEQQLLLVRTQLL